MSRPTPRPLVRRLLAGAVALAAPLAVAPILSVAGAAPASAVEAQSAADVLTGSGTSADPYLIGSAADLDTAAAMVDADASCSGAAAATYRMTSDVDYAGGTFADFTATFCGTFDGNGHTISRLVNTATTSGTTVSSALFYALSGATVEHLTLDHLSTVPPNQVAANSYAVAGLAGTATSSTITGIGLTGSTVSVTTGSTGIALGGLVNTTSGTAGSPTTISDSYLSGTTVTGLKYVGGLVATVGSYTTVEDDFVSAAVSNVSSGAGETATLLVRSITGTAGVTVQDNVIHSGSITRSFGSSSYTGGWVSGTAAGTGRTLTGNLVNANNSLNIAADSGLNLTASPIAVPSDWPYGSSFALTWSGNHPYDYTGCTGTADPVTGTKCWTIGSDGTATDPAALAQQSTYDTGGLGWDFAGTWTWDATAQHPVLVAAPAVTTTTRTITVNQGTALDAAALESRTGAAIDHGVLSADLSGVDTSVTGTGTATLVGTFDGFTTVVPITVTVQAPAPILTVPTTTISVPEGAMPTQAAVLAATGASSDTGTLGVDFGSLTAADFATPGATVTVSVTATSGSGSATPVPVTLDVTLPGSGTASAPYLVGSATDLDYAAATMNADTAHQGAASADYALTADIDYGGRTFAGIGWFGGTFDGAGHTISDLVDPTSTATAPVTTMFTTVNGTIENLVLSHVTANVTCAGSATYYASALVNSLTGGTVRGVELTDSSVVMTPGACATNSFVGGLVRVTSGAAIIRDSMVWNTAVGGNKYDAGVVSAIGAGAVVSHNLVSATIFQPTSGSGAAVAGIVEQATLPVTVTGNVLYGGSVTAGTGSSPASGGTHTVGAVGGGSGTFDDSTDLVSSAAAINPSGNGNATTPLNGTARSAADLSLQATYEAVGWSFTDGSTPWAWDATAARPTIRTAPLLQLTGATEYGYPAGAETPAEATAAILAASAPTIDQGSTHASYGVDLSGVDLGTVGTYTGLVTATDGGATATPRPVSIDVLDPATLTVDVLDPTIDLTLGDTLSADDVLARSGATAEGTITVDAADLAAVDAATATGDYPVRLTTTAHNVTGPAVTVTVHVVAPGTPVIEVTSTRQSHVAGDALTASGGALVLTVAGATTSDGSTPSVVFPSGFDETTPGVATVTLTDGAATPVVLEVTLTAVPVPVITLAHTSVSYPEGGAVSAADVLAALGADITHADTGASVSLDLSGVDFGASGAYPVEVTGAYRGVAAVPVAATINILLPGSGTAADPYLIGSAGDLDAAAALVDQDTAHTGAAVATFALRSDIDYGGHTFAGFTWFGGTFDGAGHTISDITYATTTAAKPITAMFATVTGTIEDLVLSHVTSAVTCVGGATYYAAGVVDTLSGTLTRVVLADSSVVMTKGACATNSFTGGLVRTATGTISDDMVWNTTVVGNKYAGGLTSSGTATITDNIVNATISQTTSGSGAGAGGVQASGAPAVARGNVIYDGSIGGTGTHTTAAIGQETTAGTPLGTDNLVSTGFLIAAGTNAATPDNGTSTPAATLATQAAYAGIGWDFSRTGPWRWVDAGAASHPILSYLAVDFSAPVVAVSRPAITVSAQGEVPTTAELLAEFGAAADHGTLGLDLGDDTGDAGTGVNFELPGSYPITVTSLDHGVTTTLPATIVITALIGDGTAADPLQLGSRADLDSATTSLDLGNPDIQAAYASAHYVLTADIDYQGDDFPGIDHFSGVFDGRGHTISNLTYVPSTSSVPDGAVLAFFRDLDGASVTGLSLNDVVAHGTDDVGGLAGTVHASTLTDDSVLTATLTSTNGDVGGLVGGTAYSNTLANTATGTSDGATTTIADDEILATTLSGPWVVGGVAAVAHGGVTITRTLVDAALTDTAVAGPGHGTSAGGILGAVDGASGTVAVSDNVLIGGGVSFDHPGARTGVAGSVIGDTSGTWTEADDLVSPAAVLDADLTGAAADSVQGDQDGTAVAAGELGAQSAFGALGWDFAAPVWAWDATRVRPTLAGVPEIVVPTVSLTRQAVAYQVGHVPAAAQILADLGASVAPSGSPALDLGGADLTQVGTYAVQVSGVLGGAGSRLVTVTVDVVPIVTISTAVTQVEYVAGSVASRSQFLADAGAALNTTGTLDADLSGVSWSTPGTYPITISASDDFGFDAQPVTVDLVVMDAPAPPVGTGSPVTPGTVTIALPAGVSDARVGTLLAADPGTWSPAGTPAYQWLRDGEAIAGAAAATYTPTPADAGHLLQVRVTEQPSGEEAVSADSAPVSVGSGRFVAPRPTLTGTAQVGQTLRVTAGTWTPAPEALAYQWLRGGVPIAGATGTAYTLRSADAGALVSVQVVGVATGYATEVVTSASRQVAKASAPVAALKTLAHGTVTVRGTLKVGKRLRAAIGSWHPKPHLRYQWRLNGTNVKGATKATYVLPKRARGMKVSVVVTGSLTGYRTARVTSASKKVA